MVIEEAASPGGAGDPATPTTTTLAGVDLAVSFGGDGTMLRTVDLAKSSGVPVLGVNLGRLGYLTEVEPAGLETALGRFLSGDYVVEERMTLEVSVEPGPDSGGDRAVGATVLALNEAVLEKTVPGHTIRVSASIAGRPFVTYAADGVLVATPTGSTAYNLSVRGPILSPRLRAIVLTPISPHMLFDRALVLEPDEWLRLEVAGPRPGVLVIDGLSAGVLQPGDAVVCRAAEARARLVSFGERDFHSVLKARFHLTDR
jgi:NAD+ kinase